MRSWDQSFHPSHARLRIRSSGEVGVLLRLGGRTRCSLMPNGPFSFVGLGQNHSASGKQEKCQRTFRQPPGGGLALRVLMGPLPVRCLDSLSYCRHIRYGLQVHGPSLCLRTEHSPGCDLPRSSLHRNNCTVLQHLLEVYGMARDTTWISISLPEMQDQHPNVCMVSRGPMFMDGGVSQSLAEAQITRTSSYTSSYTQQRGSGANAMGSSVYCSFRGYRHVAHVRC